jgi:hypothetical protein
MTQHRKKKLLDRVRDAIRTKHYSIRTEEAYVNWIKRFILFHDKRHPKEMGADEVEELMWILKCVRSSSVMVREPRIGSRFCPIVSSIPYVITCVESL